MQFNFRRLCLTMSLLTLCFTWLSAQDRLDRQSEDFEARQIEARFDRNLTANPIEGRIDGIHYETPQTAFVLDGQLFQPEAIADFADVDLFFFFDPFQELLMVFLDFHGLEQYIEDLSVQMKSSFTTRSSTPDNQCTVTRICNNGTTISCSGNTCYSDWNVCGGYVICDGVITNCPSYSGPTRWVESGCCYGGPVPKRRYIEQIQICGVWTNTGEFQCKNGCPYVE